MGLPRALGPNSSWLEYQRILSPQAPVIKETKLQLGSVIPTSDWRLFEVTAFEHTKASAPSLLDLPVHISVSGNFLFFFLSL